MTKNNNRRLNLLIRIFFCRKTHRERVIAVVIAIIIYIHHELGLNRPVSTSSDGLFQGVQSRLCSFGL